jgi:hypothetical protein
MKIRYEAKQDSLPLHIQLNVSNEKGQFVGSLDSSETLSTGKSGEWTADIESWPFRPGSYSVNCRFLSQDRLVDRVDTAAVFRVRPVSREKLFRTSGFQMNLSWRLSD